MKNLLIHICCAPCLAYPYEVLEEMKRQGEVESIAGIFYNPNIHPEDEFERRMDAVRTFSEMKDLPVEYFADFEMRKWLDFKGAKDERCLMCYSGRLEKTAAYAAANGFDAFTTSLLVSPYQKHDLIRSIGEELARKYGLHFHYRDFREGYRHGQNIARDMGLYRQKYCGCVYKD